MGKTNKKRVAVGAFLMIFGALLVIVSLATAANLSIKPLAIGDVAHSWPCESLTGEWSSVYNGYGNLSISTDHVQGSYSIQNEITGYASYVVMVGSYDWSEQAELHFSMKVSYLSSVDLRFVVDSYDDSGVDVSAFYYLTTPSDTSWHSYTVDLTTPTTGTVYLNRVLYVTFYYNVNGHPDVTQLIDNIYTVYTSSTPTPAPSPTPTPSSTPTPTPSGTPSSTLPPGATPTPTPQATSEPGATPTASPSPFYTNDNLNRIGAISGIISFFSGFIVVFTGWKVK